MPNRYEFTAADGSRRWCSQELLGAERLTETCGHFRASGDYCGVCSALRVRSLSLLKPKPTGLRWRHSRPHGEWYLVTRRDSVDTCIGWLSPGAPGVWNAFYAPEQQDDCSRVGGAGSPSTCAHALVDAVRETQHG